MLIANLNQFTEVPYPLWMILSKQKIKLRIFVEHNRFDYTRGLLTLTPLFSLEGKDKSIEVFLVDDGVHKRF